MAKHLKAVLNADVPYERYTLTYSVPSRQARYTPDFVLPNGIIIETKGRFLPADRQKHILIKQQHPELDIRFVFTNSRNKLYKGSPNSYADWCDKHGFRYADKTVPPVWLREEPDPAKLEALNYILKKKGDGKA